MTYEQYRKAMKTTNFKEMSALIRFASKNPGLHMQYMKRYAKEGKGG